MAAQFSVTTGLTALTAATAKTMIELSTTANTSAELIALSVSSSYLTTATPLTLTVELGTYTGTGTGTAYTAKRVGTGVGVAQTTAKINDSAEPAGFTSIHVWDLTLPGDRLDYQWPLGREYFLTTSAFNGIRVTAPVGTPSVRVTLWFEE